MNMYRLTPICLQHQKEYLKSYCVNAKEIAHLGDAVVERVVSTATLVVLTAERMTANKEFRYEIEECDSDVNE